jgi:hypothetical protein
MALTGSGSFAKKTASSLARRCVPSLRARKLTLSARDRLRHVACELAAGEFEITGAKLIDDTLPRPISLQHARIQGNGQRQSATKLDQLASKGLFIERTLQELGQ